MQLAQNEAQHTEDGVPIVLGSVIADRGRVDVLSRVGAGSTFTVVIPTDQPVQEVR